VLLLHLLALSPLAIAHPIGAQPTSHHLRLTLVEDEIVVDYRVLVPTRSLGDTSLEGHLASLKAGLVLNVDGEMVPLVSQPVDAPITPARSQAVGFQVGLRGEIPLSDAAQAFLLVNGNEPDVLSTFASEIHLGPGWTALSSSLLIMGPEGITENRHGQWRMDEESRELALQAVRTPRWQQVFRGERLQPAYKALGFTRPTWLLPGIAGAAVLLLLLAGWRHRIRPRA
jgi:hypothetical protein